ncbi:MAG: copper amine oxidase N-terminal domain-containing protein [Clostridiales bacterium]|jgi:hypothetical protein|nr:copper amine oxidase N-terminal domain-containing protein [Clostridiales bacterium]
MTSTLAMAALAIVFAGQPDKALSIDSNASIYIDGERFGGKEVQALNYCGKIYLPLRALGEALGKELFWHENTKSVFIGSKKNLADFLRTALVPVGETMYIWGGGWNEEDTAAGPEAMTIGASANWASFARKQTKSYNYSLTRYRIHDGLDCTGFIGWAIYNLVPNDGGYVFKSNVLASSLSNIGLGSMTARSSVKTHLAGDIMSTSGHAWISLGTCADGSVAILHSSPPGVSICGTQVGSVKSEAVKLAEKYMSKYFPEWYEKYPNCNRNASYLTGYDKFSWDESLLSDPDGLRKKDAAQVLSVLFNE